MTVIDRDAARASWGSWLALTLLFGTTTASAVPSFARQTTSSSQPAPTAVMTDPMPTADQKDIQNDTSRVPSVRAFSQS